MLLVDDILAELSTIIEFYNEEDPRLFIRPSYQSQGSSANSFSSSERLCPCFGR